MRINLSLLRNRRRVEQLAAHRAHNPGVVGSSPTPAKNNDVLDLMDNAKATIE